MIRSALVLAFLLLCSASAQDRPAFAAASVKQNHSASTGMGGTIGIKRGGSISMRNVNARMLIEIAYGVSDYQLSRGPSWMDSAGYDVEAKPEQPVDNKTAKLMLQSMLADRFQLRTHHETTTVNGFHLVIDKGGSKLVPSEAKGIGFRIMSLEEIQGPADMPMLAGVLKGILRAPVEDHTGLSGKYEIRVKWTPENGSAMAADGGQTPPEPVVSIFAAFRLQLGLSLDPVKIPVDLIVIDHVERPTEN